MNTGPTATEAATSIAQLLLEATATLAAADVGTPRLDAEVLLAAACGMDRTALYVRGQEPVPERCQESFQTMLTRRIAREPLAYIVGRQEFWSLDFEVTLDVLIPRPETELLVELALGVVSPESDDFRKQSLDTAPEEMGPTRDERQELCHSNPEPLALSSRPPLAAYRRVPAGRDSRFKRPLLCDLGTGSGCIAVALACELPHAQVWALDISAAALRIAAANAQRHGVDDRIQFIQSDLFTSANGVRFDAIIANPPYVCSAAVDRLQPELRWEPRQALDGGVTGLHPIERLLTAAPEHLIDGGWLLMEIGADQDAAVSALAHAAGFSEVSVRTDYAGLPRVVLARR